MLKTVIVLPDGTELSSGGHAINAVQSVTLTECVNSGEELTLGSTCANALEATLLTPKGGLAIAAGAEVTVYKEDPTGFRKPVGIFILEKPTRPSANTMKLTGYDRVSKLDKDLTAWLSGLDGWPYQLTTFAYMVCEACGLTFEQSHIANEDTFLVQQFSRSSVTGRQIMRWLGEIGCRFCHATPEGIIQFEWYMDSGKTITATGDPYYFQNGLTYEDFNTAPIDAVQIRLADSEDGALWPEAEGGANSYIITGNPILNAKIGNELEEALEAIKAELIGVTYTPCKVEIPANMDIRAGNTVKITDKNGKTITAYVMTKTQTGQKDTLECTGSPRRDSSSAVNNQSSSSAANSAAQNAFAGMTYEQLFNKLTDGGRIQGIFSRDNVWVFNAAMAVIENLTVKSAQIENLDAGKITGLIDSERINGHTLNIAEGARIANFHIYAGSIFNGIHPGQENSCGMSAGSALSGNDEWIFWAGNGAFRVTLGGELHTTNLIASGGLIAGWEIDDNSIRAGTLGQEGSMWLCRNGTDTPANIGTESGNGWCIGVGANFGVKKDGSMFSSSGIIAGWYISEHGLSSGKWQSESNITETDDIVAISSDLVQHVYFDAQDGTAFYNRAEWDWIIGSARAWAEANSLL